MNSTGKKVPPSPKPRMCVGSCNPKKRAVKGRTMCSQCEFEAFQRTERSKEHAASGK